MPNPAGLDFAALTEDTRFLDSHIDDTGVLRDGAFTMAKAMCGTCPTLLGCRSRARLEVDVAGVAGGEDEAERNAWRVRHGVTVEALRLAVLVPEWPLLLLDLSTETRPSGQATEITVEELVAIHRLTADGWTVEEIAGSLVTVTAAGRVAWSIDRVRLARAILAGGRGGRARRTGVVA
jgi:hypothetical protein